MRPSEDQFSESEPEAMSDINEFTSEYESEDNSEGSSISDGDLSNEQEAIEYGGDDSIARKEQLRNDPAVQELLLEMLRDKRQCRKRHRK